MKFKPSFSEFNVKQSICKSSIIESIRKHGKTYSHFFTSKNGKKKWEHDRNVVIFSGI